MRKIKARSIVVFSILFVLILLLGIGTTTAVLGGLPLGDFRGIIMVTAALFFIYLYAFLVHRLFLYAMPLKEGSIVEGSKDQFGYHVFLLFYLILFFPIMRSGFLPLPLMRLIYIALGARLGDNTYSSGIILDPPFIEIGENTIIGQYALLIPHVIEGERLAHYGIKIGNNVTVGAHAVVMAGVTIEDNSIVGTGAIVPKGTHIGTGEIWGGVPAKKIKNVEPSRTAVKV
jgi:acetyltransferase-like isoleucine patch superfamily enzyme